MTEIIHRINRRDLPRLGLAAGPAALVAACGWDGDRPSSRSCAPFPGSTIGSASIFSSLAVD